MSLVLGGGISGLSVAHYLLKNGSSKVKLLEATSRVGGWIETTLHPGGPVFEHGPRTVRPRGEAGANTLSLIEELHLDDKVVAIPSTHPAALNRLIYVNNRLHALPSSLLSLFKTNPPFSRPLISSLFNDLLAPKKSVADESIYDFVARRLGKEIADYGISPMICGICAGDAKEISVKFLMKSLFEAEQKHGSIVGGMFRNMFGSRQQTPVMLAGLSKQAIEEKWSVWSLKGGLEQLPKAMATSIKTRGASIQTDEPCQEITFHGNGVTTRTSKSLYESTHLYSTIPARKLAPLVREQHPELADDLSMIPLVSVAVVNLQYSGHVLPGEAFGFLIPPAEKIPLLGVIYDSCCFPYGDSTVVTAMMGGWWFEELFGPNPSEEFLLEIAVTHIGKILGIKAKPEAHKVSVLRDCIPQYVVGHHDRVDRIREYVKRNELPLSLVGASYDGVGVNDVIMSAKKAVGQSGQR